MWRIVAGGNRPYEPCVPVDALSRMAAGFRGQEDPLPSARKLGTGRFSIAVLEAIDKCLELEPRDRPADCGEFLRLLAVPAGKDLIEGRHANAGKDEGGRVERGSLVNNSPKNAGSASETKPPTELGAKRSRRKESGPTTVVVTATVLLIWLTLMVVGLVWLGGRPDLNRRGNSESESIVELRGFAARGDPMMQWLLGSYYEFGLGEVPKDYTEAVTWYRMAAEQGHIESQYDLGRMYKTGRGVPRDDVLAYAWTNLAAAQGSIDAEKERDLMLFDMTATQIAEGNSLSRRLAGAMLFPRLIR